MTIQFKFGDGIEATVNWRAGGSPIYYNADESDLARAIAALTDDQRRKVNAVLMGLSSPRIISDSEHLEGYRELGERLSKAERTARDQALAVFENAPHRSIADDGTEIIEWIAPDFRVGISLEAPRADSWFFCVDGGKRMCGGDIKGDDE